MTLTGDADSNDILITQIGINEFLITGNNLTTITLNNTTLGAQSIKVPGNTLADTTLKIKMNGGNDIVRVGDGGESVFREGAAVRRERRSR